MTMSQNTRLKHNLDYMTGCRQNLEALAVESPADAADLTCAAEFLARAVEVLARVKVDEGTTGAPALVAA